MKELSREIQQFLNSLPYEQLRNVERYVNELQRIKYKEWEIQKHAEWDEQDRKRKLAELKFRRNNLPKIRAFLKGLAPGTTLKMKGCRDGQGARIFLNYDVGRGLVECRQVFIDKDTQTRTNGQITVHMDNKVQAWMENGKWRKDF